MVIVRIAGLWKTLKSALTALWRSHWGDKWSSSKFTVLTCERKVWKINSCFRMQDWLYITLSSFLHLRCHAVFYWGQLTANYLLNREVNPLDLVREKEVNQPLRWEEPANDFITDLENVTKIGSIAHTSLCLIKIISWWQLQDLANGLITSESAGRETFTNDPNFT